MNIYAAAERSATANNRDLSIPYVTPYLAFVAVASLPEDWFTFEWNYILRLLLVVPLLAFYWRSYVSLTGPRSRFISGVVGAAAGVVGTVL